MKTKLDVEKLKSLYPKLWLQAQKKFSNPTEAEKFFILLLKAKKYQQKAKEYEAKTKNVERKRRTRALILLALSFLDYLVATNKESFLQKFNPLIGKEGKQEINYFPYILNEVERIKNKK